MKWTPALITGLALAIFASPAGAQSRHDDRRFETQSFSPTHGFPVVHDAHPSPQPVREAAPKGPNDALGAGWSPEQDQVRQGVTQKRFVPLGQAIETIRRRGAGRELDAGLEQWNGRPAYRVRWAASDGRRIDYIVDAETGAILSVDGGP